MNRLGYRQRRVLRVLKERGKPTPLAYIANLCSFPDDNVSAYKNTSAALRGLRRRGLVEQTRHGWWTA